MASFLTVCGLAFVASFVVIVITACVKTYKDDKKIKELNDKHKITFETLTKAQDLNDQLVQQYASVVAQYETLANHYKQQSEDIESLRRSNKLLQQKVNNAGNN